MISNEKLATLFSKWKGGVGIKAALALAVVGVILLLLPSKQEKTSQKQQQQTVQQYCETVEQRLMVLLQEMDGVGQCAVYVTLENGVEYVYAKQQKENADRTEDRDDKGEQVKESADTQESVILIKGDDGEAGLLLTEIQPQIKGVVVVCSGGEDETVKERVTAVVTTALNISARRVCVTR